MGIGIVDILEAIFVMILFIMGTVFGSFLTLAVYRIPLGIDITHKRSFCPKCNHKLGFWDMIPFFSYIGLDGKCRYCGEKIRARYFLLEFFSGMAFITAYFSFDLNFPFLTVENVSNAVGFLMFYITNCLILGIDKEYIGINKKILLFGIITNSIYMLYLYSFDSLNLYRYGIYLVALLILFLLDTLLIKRKGKKSYLLQILMLLVYEISYIRIKPKDFKLSLALVLAFMIIYSIYKLIKKEKKIPVGFCVCLASIISVLIGNIVWFIY